MSEPWGPHDIGGQMAGPIDLSEHENTHWEWQIDAMVRLALSKGLICDFAELRTMVLPQRPAGTEDWSEEDLAALVTRDSLIGTQRDLSPK